MIWSLLTFSLALAGNNDFQVIDEAFSDTHFRLLLSVDAKNTKIIDSIQQIEGVNTVARAKEGVIFLWDNSGTMQDELQRFPKHYQYLEGALSDGSYDIKMYTFRDQPVLLLPWTSNLKEGEAAVKELSKQQIPVSAKSKFLETIESVITDNTTLLESVDGSSKYDVLHMYTYSDGWDDWQETEEFKAEEKTRLRTVFSNPRIRSQVALLSTCTRDQPTCKKRPTAWRNLLDLCNTISGFQCTELMKEPKPKRPTRSYWIEGDVCTIPEGTALYNSIKKQTGNCGPSSNFWYAMFSLVLVIGGVVAGFWWREKQNQKKKEQIRQNILASRKSTVLFTEEPKMSPETKRKASTTSELTQSIEYKVSFINLNTMQNIGNYSNLSMKQLTIGSNHECGLVLESPFVSGEHLLIDFGPSTISIQDLNSANGSTYNQIPLQPYVSVAVQNGTIIILGDVSIQVVIQ